MRVLLATTALALVLPYSANALDIFPGAVGAGKDVTAGRGGSLCFVTNTNDTGTGSLRDCLVNTSGNRTIIFRTGGNISLGSKMETFDGSVRIAGETAPGGGISIETPNSTSWCGAMVGFKGGSAGNVFISNVRFRPGTASGSTCRHDALNFDNTQTSGGVYLRNLSLEGGSDENLDFYRHVEDVTVERSILAYGLLSHSKGSLQCDDSTTCGNFTFFENLYASNLDRNPDIQNAPGDSLKTDFISNVVYNPTDGSELWDNQCISTNCGPYVNFVGNVYIAGPDTTNNTAAIRVHDNPPTASAATRFYAPKTGTHANISDLPLCQGVGEDFDDCIVRANNVGTHSTSVNGTLTATQNWSAANLWANIDTEVGAIRPSRDSLDSDIATCVTNESGCDQVSALPSRPTLSAGTAPTDADNDGVPDADESTYGMTTGVTDNNGDADSDGYTNLEEYLNALIAGSE